MRKLSIFLGVLGFMGMVALPFAALAVPGGKGNGNGNAWGWGYGNGKGNGRGGGGGASGGPLPALGVTLAGQAVGAAGLFFAWRRRRKRANKG